MKILDRVKRDITREMESQQTHTGSSWADIMLRHSSKLQKTEDQKEFWKWLLDPNEEQDIEMTFAEIDPPKIEVVKEYTVKTDDEKTEDVPMVNVVHREGFISYIVSKPVNGSKYTSLQQPKHQDPKCVD